MRRVFCCKDTGVLLDWIPAGLDGIRVDFGCIRSLLLSLLDELDHGPKIQLNPIAQKGRCKVHIKKTYEMDKINNLLEQYKSKQLHGRVYIYPKTT